MSHVLSSYNVHLTCQKVCKKNNDDLELKRNQLTYFRTLLYGKALIFQIRKFIFIHDMLFSSVQTESSCIRQSKNNEY